MSAPGGTCIIDFDAIWVPAYNAERVNNQSVQEVEESIGKLTSKASI